MKNINNALINKENNRGLFFQLSFFALLAMMSLFSGQISAQRQQTCIPKLTVTNDTSLPPDGRLEFTVSSAPSKIIIDASSSPTGLRELKAIGSSTNMSFDSPTPILPATYSGASGETVYFSVINPNQAVDFTLRAASLYHAVFIRVRCGCTPQLTVTDDTTLPPDGRLEFTVSSAPGKIIIDASSSPTGLRELKAVGPSTNMSFDSPTPTLPATYASGATGETVYFSMINPNQAVDFTLRAASLYHAVFIRVRCGCTPNLTVTDDTSLPPDGRLEFTVSSAPGKIIIDASSSPTKLRGISVVGTPNNVSFDSPASLNTTAAATYSGGVASETVEFTEINPNQAIDFTLRAESLYHAVFIRVQCPCTPKLTVTDDPAMLPNGLNEFSVSSAPGQIKIIANPAGTGLRELKAIGPSTNMSFDSPTPILPATYSGAAGETVYFSVIDASQPTSFKLRAASLYHAVFIEVQCGCTGNGNRRN